jgi:transposase
MTEKDGYLMGTIDRQKLKVISVVVEKKMKQWEAAEKLGISERQIRRLVKRYRKYGDEGLIHKLRGREASNKISKEIRDKGLWICIRKNIKDLVPRWARKRLLKSRKYA